MSHQKNAAQMTTPRGNAGRLHSQGFVLQTFGANLQGVSRTYLSLEEAAAYLGPPGKPLSKSSMYRLCDKGLPYHKVANVRWFLRDDLDEFIASQRRVPYRVTRRR